MLVVTNILGDDILIVLNWFEVNSLKSKPKIIFQFAVLGTEEGF